VWIFQRPAITTLIWSSEDLKMGRVQLNEVQVRKNKDKKEKQKKENERDRMLADL
jgi:hypothetical protein